MLRFRQILFNLEIAGAILVRISTDRAGAVLGKDCSHVFETSYLFKLLTVHFHIHTDVIRTAGHDLALFCADLHSKHPCSVLKSVDQVLKLAIAKIDVIGES